MNARQREVVELLQGKDRRGRSRGKPLIEGFELLRTGLRIDEGVDQRTWYEFGKLLHQADYGWEWLVADWLAFGNHKYGDGVYKLAARLLGKAPRTWEDYAYIARNVKISERSEILPVLTHKAVAPFGKDPELQRKLIAIGEQYGLGKSVFEEVIELYLARKSYKHLLPANMSPLTRASLQAEKERERVRKRALETDGGQWLDFARAQADAWSLLVSQLSRKDGRGRAVNSN
jgi:hypothetical protein